jgi:ribosomal protein L40E
MDSFLPILALWAVIGGLVGAVIGNTKNRFVAGFMFGFLLGPAGWLLVAFGAGENPVCPYCKGQVFPGAVKCKNCGSDLPARRPSPPRGQQAAGPRIEETACPYCGRRIPADAAKCRLCGAQLPQPKS